MAFRFCADETVADNILRLARARVKKALEALAHPSDGAAAETVHAARKEFKRLRALLRLVRPALGRKRFEKENTAFRNAGRTLSAVRDAQALVAAFDKLLEPDRARSQVGQNAALRVRSELTHDCEVVEQVVALPSRLPALITELNAVRERISADWPLVGDDWWLIGTGLRATYRQGRRASKRVDARRDDAVAWHELRKRVKDLGYQLRVLRPLWPHVLKGVGRDLDALADALGDEHDLVVLRARLLDNPEPWVAPADLENFGTVIDARRAELHDAAHALARRIYREKPSEFEDRLHGYWKIWRAENRSDSR